MQDVPAQLGHYTIVSPLGAGGMGQVYLALDTRLNRQVAIKVLLGGSVGEEANLRMLREARLVATIDHPNVCTIYEIDEAEGAPYIVMQYIHGETLVDRMARGGITLAEVIDLARQVTSALAEAHSRGIVHRDIKPGNIMISSSGVVKVLDFGLAKSFLLHGSNDATEVMISTPGLVSGTVSYMSPEQLRAEAIDGRSDIFSLGVVLYEIATGKRPFDHPAIAATISAILTKSPAPIESAEMAPLEPLILRALEKRPERRFATAAAMHDALGSISRPRTRAATRSTAALPKQPLEPKRKSEASGTRRRAKKAPAPDPAAEKLYLRGRAQWNKRHPDALRQAITLFHEAIDIDPMHANSHAGLADAYVILGVLQVIAPKDILPKARASALRAIELAPELAEPHASLGYVAGIFDWDWATAERELHEAMRLNPRYPWAPHWYGLLAMSKSLDTALEYVTRARDLDPLSPFLATAVGIVHHIRRENVAAVRIYSQLLDTEEAFAPGHYYLGLTYEQMGRYDDATEHLRIAAAMGSRGSLFVGALGHCYAVSGQSELAREVLAGMEEEDERRYVSPYNRLLIHLGLGDREETLRWLERSLEDRSSWLWFMRADSRFDSMRNDGRYRELVTRYGLEPQGSQFSPAPVCLFVCCGWCVPGSLTLAPSPSRERDAAARSGFCRGGVTGGR